jgi:tetratricopeptide (TPR) repeat protein
MPCINPFFRLANARRASANLKAKNWTIITIALFAAIVTGFSAHAQDDHRNIELCGNDNPNISIPACTALIESSKKVEGVTPIEAVRGIGFMGLEQYTRAIQDFDEAIRVNPNDAALYRYRGNCYLRVGDYHRAIEDYTRALRLEPDNKIALFDRGFSYIKLGDYDRAISEYTRLIQFAPDSRDTAEAYTNRGIAFAAKKNIGQALDDYNKAIQLNPNLAEAYYVRGKLYSEHVAPGSAEPDYGIAINDYIKALENNRIYAGAYRNRGNAYYFVGQYPRALADFSLALLCLAWERIHGLGLLPRLSVLTLLALIAVGLGLNARRKVRRKFMIVQLGRVTREVALNVSSRFGHFARCGALPLSISIIVLEYQYRIDGFADLLLAKVGIRYYLPDGSGTLAIIALCVQAFAVRCHQISMDEPESLVRQHFWRPYLTFTTYTLSLTLIGIAARYAAFSMAPVSGSESSMPTIRLLVIASVCVLATGVVARFALMLPAAAIERPLLPLQAWRFLRANTGRLNIVIAIFVAGCAALKWLFDKGLVLIPDEVIPPWLRAISSDAVGQFSVFLATVLIASTLSICYRRLVVRP